MESDSVATINPPLWLVVFVSLMNVMVVSSALYIWGSSRNWEINSTYQIFPLLGLLAFSLMWCHYVTAAIIRVAAPGTKLSNYFRITGYVVLACILLHPGLLVYQLWIDGLGLPPFSYGQYVGQAGKLFVTFGTVGLLCFLLYETKGWLSKTSFWPFIVALSDIAMILIVFHGLRLGSNLQSGWYRGVWLFYGVILLICIVQRVISLPPKPQETAE